jgi:hypothetical protein
MPRGRPRGSRAARAGLGARRVRGRAAPPAEDDAAQPPPLPAVATGD